MYIYFDCRVFWVSEPGSNSLVEQILRVSPLWGYLPGLSSITKIPAQTQERTSAVAR